MTEAQQIESIYLTRVAAARADPWTDLPAWARADPDGCFGAAPVLVCGSLQLGVVRFLANHVNVVGIVDDFRSLKERSILGIPLIDSDEWIRMAKVNPALVAVNAATTVAGYNHFSRCTAQHGMRTLLIHQANRLLAHRGVSVVGAGSPFIYGLNYREHALNCAEEFQSLANKFEDDYSRFTLFSLLDFRLTGDPNTLSRCAVGYCSDRYSYNTYIFNRSFIELSDNEVFVDGGAFDGNSLADFARAVHGRFKRVYCFEASEELAKRCKRRVAEVQSQYIPPVMDRVEIIAKGLWDSETILHFNPGLYAGIERTVTGNSGASGAVGGHVIEGSFVQHLFPKEAEIEVGFTVPTTTIDLTCEPGVTFIKLEIEGSELKALHGARNTIARDRPRMALSIYHKPEDLLTLTGFVGDTGLGYRMSLRQHNPLVSDATVCYCY